MRTMAQFSRLSDDNTASGEDIYTIDISTVGTIDISTVAHTEMETAPITRSYFERTPAVESLELETLELGTLELETLARWPAQEAGSRPDPDCAAARGRA